MDKPQRYSQHPRSFLLLSSGLGLIFATGEGEVAFASPLAFWCLFSQHLKERLIQGHFFKDSRNFFPPDAP
jgi:hypothetical protein